MTFFLIKKAIKTHDKIKNLNNKLGLGKDQCDIIILEKFLKIKNEIFYPLKQKIFIKNWRKSILQFF